MGAGARLDARLIGHTERWSVAGCATLLTGVAALLLLPVLAKAPTLDAPALRATLEMALTGGALAAARLMHARFLDSRRVRDLLAMTAVATLGLTNLADGVLPAVVTPGVGTSLLAAQLWSELLVAGLFTAAAFTSGARLAARPRRLVALATATSIAGASAATVAGVLLRAATLGRGPGAAVSLLHHPLVFALCVPAIALLGSAAARLAAGEPHQSADGASGTLATACVLFAAVGLHQLVRGLPAVGTVAPTELPRALAFVLVLIAAARYEPQARRRLAAAAALAERHRVARDLHDRLAQDLALIAAHGPALSAELGNDHPLVIAAQRALAISRDTISELSDPAEATVAQALDAVAHELRGQFDVAIAVNVRLEDELEPRAREHITRISREAIANAARHGGARNVSVSLTRLELAVVLRVIDDGCGLVDERGAASPEGFGLGSIRERAAALGGSLSVHQPQRGGVELEVVFR